MQKELWANACASGEALASPRVTSCDSPKWRACSQANSNSHPHHCHKQSFANCTHQTVVLYSVILGSYIVFKWSRQSPITPSTWHGMSWTIWGDQNQLDRTDWPKEDGFYNYQNGLDHPTNWEDPDLDEGFAVSAMILGKKLYLNSRSKLY